MLQGLTRFCLALATVLCLHSAHADPVPPTPLTGGRFADGVSTITSPYGGSYAMDLSGWNAATSSGTIKMTYTNFGLKVGNQSWTYNGGWTYTGSLSAAGLLDGNVTGSWTIAGVDVAQITGMQLGINTIAASVQLQFKAGKANGSLTASLQTMYPGMPAITQTLPINFDQSQALGLLI
jgi:hypothetical protein